MSTRASHETRDRYALLQSMATRWMDNDQYGHLNNVVYHALFDSAVNAYLIDSGALRPGAEDVEMLGLVVESHCQYQAPAGFPRPMEIGLRVGHVGNSSVRYEFAAFIEGHEQACALGYYVHVYVDPLYRRPLLHLPAALRDALRRLEVTAG
ncbi:acyl-CoA thioesterase [Pseudomonas sp. A014]|uniref:acyl-CoA thioesterase n=1 Tax=Pseudomonas sp. A014 TaxID=3458058 RepID=UPI00403580C9